MNEITAPLRKFIGMSLFRTWRFRLAAAWRRASEAGRGSAVKKPKIVDSVLASSPASSSSSSSSSSTYVV